uniref:Uncharacterized protein n=1 Tax=Haptolina ericina TaxID=156174 RepID=A0A7S3F7F9_9EUKA
MVCDDKDTLMRGSVMMLIGGPLALLAQVIVLVSFLVTSEVVLRHLKNTLRDEKAPLYDDPAAMSRARMANSKKCHQNPAASYSSGGDGCRAGPTYSASSAGGYGGYGGREGPTFESGNYNGGGNFNGSGYGGGFGGGATNGCGGFSGFDDSNRQRCVSDNL